MSTGVTEIIEKITTQLEIIESGSGVIEVVDNKPNSIEISFSGSSITSDLDIITKSEIITVEGIPEDNIINISENPPLNLEITSENTTLEIIDRVLLSGSFDLAFNNLTSNPFTVDDSGRVGRGRSRPDYDLHVAGTLFSDIVSSSKVETNELILHSEENVNLLSVTSGSNTPLTINPKGVIVLDNFQYTPPPVEGGLLFSGSNFYLGLE